MQKTQVPALRRKFVQSLAAGAMALGTSGGWLRRVHSQSTTPENRSGRRIKIGQIGTGHAHASKLAAYRTGDDYEVVGIVEPDPQLRAKASSQAVFQGLKWMTQEELLNVSGLEAVLVETRVRDLLKTAQTCVQAGKHVHIDKPAGESLAQFRAILDLAEKQKLMVQMGYMYRYNPGVVLLRDFLRKGWLGEIFEVHTVMSKVIAADGRKELEEYRGGMMFELGCHVMDLVIGILGKPQMVTYYNLHSSQLPDSLLDNMLAVLSYPRATATIKSSCMEVDGGERRHLAVCGTEGTFHIQPLDNPGARIALTSAKGGYVRGYQDVKLPKYTRYVDDAADMARVLRGEKSFGFSYAHDLCVQATLLQACGMPVN